MLVADPRLDPVGPERRPPTVRDASFDDLRHRDLVPTLAQRLLRGLDHLDHRQAVATVGERRRAFPHALEEVQALQPQRLVTLDVRTEDAAVVVRELEVAERVRLPHRVHVLVVDLELLDVLEVVVHGHLLLADDGHPSRLAGIEPAQAHVGEHATRERQRQVGDVFVGRFDAADASRADAVGRFAQQVHQDRDVVRREIPDDVEVRAEEPEPDAHRVDVSDVAERAERDHRTQLGDRRHVRTDVAHHQDATATLREIDELTRVRRARRERLLHEHVEPLLEARAHDVVVRLRGGAHDDRVEPLLEEVVEVLGEHAHLRVAGRHPIETRRDPGRRPHAARHHRSPRRCAPGSVPSTHTR